MIPFDVYVLAADRSLGTIQRFLHRFAGGMEESAGEYPQPQYADEPSRVFSHFVELTDYLTKETGEVYSVYFRKCDTSEAVRNAILHFTSDGGLIVGLTVYTPDTSTLEDYLKDMAVTVSGKYGFWTIEEPPPSSAAQFIKAVRQADQPKLSP